MKKTFFSLFAILCAGTSFAQLSLGIQGVGNFSSAKFELTDVANPSKKIRTMPGLGFVAQFGLGQKAALRTGINYLQQGSKVSFTTPAVDPGDLPLEGQVNVRLSYLQLPVHLLFVAKTGGLQFFAGAGGYLAYAMNGNSTVTGTFDGANGREKFEVKDENLFKEESLGEGVFKRSDFGLSALAGVRFGGGLFANVGYQLGLSNLGSDADNVYKNRNLQLTIGYFFR